MKYKLPQTDEEWKTLLEETAAAASKIPDAVVDLLQAVADTFDRTSVPLNAIADAMFRMADVASTLSWFWAGGFFIMSAAWVGASCFKASTKAWRLAKSLSWGIFFSMLTVSLLII